MNNQFRELELLQRMLPSLVVQLPKLAGRSCNCLWSRFKFALWIWLNATSAQLVTYQQQQFVPWPRASSSLVIKFIPKDLFGPSCSEVHCIIMCSVINFVPVHCCSFSTILELPAPGLRHGQDYCFKISCSNTEDVNYLLSWRLPNDRNTTPSVLVDGELPSAWQKVKKVQLWTKL